ncbi:MAG: hypothetical protein LUG93_07330, partial [Lachnospiraceae bacterium]|nr:hypothetical protein [Lachnospiraceae bacterium]
GKMKTGWQTIDGSKYYFKKTAGSTVPKGAALTGIRTISGSKYYFASNGKMKTGLQSSDGKKYYFGSDGKMVTSSWKTVSGYKYYFKSDGTAATGGYTIGSTIYVFDTSGKLLTHSGSLKIVGVSGSYYCVNSSGKAQTSGWIIVDSTKLCYAAGNGKLKVSTTYQGITFNSSGYAKSSTASKLKIKTMTIVSSITTSSMTKAQKLRACWNYMVSGSRFSYSTVYISSYPSGWQITMAYNMLNTHSGNCYSFACAFAALAYEIGYDPYVIVGRVKGTRDGASDGLTRHCWVKINGCYYDPEACFAGWWTTCYGVSSYSITHQVIGTYRFALS